MIIHKLNFLKRSMLILYVIINIRLGVSIESLTFLFTWTPTTKPNFLHKKKKENFMIHPIYLSVPVHLFFKLIIKWVVFFKKIIFLSFIIIITKSYSSKVSTKYFFFWIFITHENICYFFTIICKKIKIIFINNETMFFLIKRCYIKYKYWEITIYYTKKNRLFIKLWRKSTGTPHFISVP